MPKQWITVRMDDGEEPKVTVHTAYEYDHEEQGIESVAVVTTAVDVFDDLKGVLQKAIETAREGALRQGRRAAARAEAVSVAYAEKGEAVAAPVAPTAVGRKGGPRGQ